jgi:hypothetical protein
MNGTEHIARREREILARLWPDVLRLAHKTRLPDVRFGSAVRLMLIYLGRGHIDPSTEIQTRELKSAAHARGQPIQIFTAGSECELDVAFESMRQLRVGALLVGSDVFLLPGGLRLLRLQRATQSRRSTSSARSLIWAV